MKIFTITLSEIKTEESNGEFIQIEGEAKRLPCFLTNYSLHYGEKHGLIKSSILDGIQGVVDATGGTTKKSDLQKNLNFGKAINTDISKVIFLGCIGANPDLDLEYEDFIRQFNMPFNEVLEIYMGLLEGLVVGEKNNKFADGFTKATKNSKKK